MGSRNRVVKLEDSCCDLYTMLPPTSLAADRRFSVVRGPLLQTPEMTMTSDGETCTILCTSEYADHIAALDAHFSSLIAENSLEYFGKSISHEQVERRFAESIHGHKTPKHIVGCDRCLCFAKDLQAYVPPPTEDPTRRTPEVAVCKMILRCDGIVFEERRCFAQWSVCQMLVVEEPVLAADEACEENPGDDEDDDSIIQSPAFLE